MQTFLTLQAQDIANNVGVQGQVFVVVNDESYFRPNLMRGMIVDGDFGSDLAIYTGSSTGASRSDAVCSAYSPITWQVDRKCQMISASSFDLMCAEMKMQRDDSKWWYNTILLASIIIFTHYTLSCLFCISVTYDLVAHGARPLVDDHLVADNQANRKTEEKKKKAGNLRALKELFW